MYSRVLGLGWPHSLAFSLLACALAAEGATQPNSWTKPSSGDWEEPYWSLGVLPGPDQPIMITNPGWKAVAIAPSTVQNFPESLNVYSVTVESPVDSFNTLLLNYAGVESPLTVSSSMMIGSNAALTMLSSAIHLAGPPGFGLSVGGQVNHSEFSHVTGGQIDVGWIGPGVYDLNGGVVDVGHIWVGGPRAGVFNQNGGILTADVLHLEPSGRYNLRGGDFDALTYTADNTEFRQDGGYVYRRLEIFRGMYRLNGGVNFTGVTVPVASNAAGDDGYAYAYQAGGTNFGPIQVGIMGAGTYLLLSNGVVQSPGISIGSGGEFAQEGGVVSTPAEITVHGVDWAPATFVPVYSLDRGFLSSKGIDLDAGSFLQYGGTNTVDGILAVGPGTHSFSRTLYYMTDGLLTTKRTTMDFSSVGGFTQNGGVHRIANELLIAGPVNGQFPYLGETWWGYRFQGGELIASNIVVQTRSAFTCRGGTLRQSGTIRLAAATLNFGLAPQQFGPLQLEISESGTYTTNTIHFPDGYGVLRFANSSAMPWAGNAKLIITGWGGPLQGGGPEQLIFGNSASGLTPAQLSNIWFQNPAGMAGFYPTRILPTGEIVPDLRTGANSPHLSIRKPASNIADVTVTGDPGRNYGIFRSANLINWVFWTNRVATNGTLTLQDTTTFNDSMRFYKAAVLQ